MQGCTAFQIQNPDGLNDRRLPVMYRGPTGMMFEPTDKDIENPDHRDIMTLGAASPLHSLTGPEMVTLPIRLTRPLVI